MKTTTEGHFWGVIPFTGEKMNTAKKIQRGFADNSNQKKDEYKKEETTVTVEDQSNQKKPKKKIFLSVFYWGVKKILLFRRLKHQLEIYFIACIPNGFKKPTVLISTWLPTSSSSSKFHYLHKVQANAINILAYNVTSLVHKRTFIHATHSMLLNLEVYIFVVKVARTQPYEMALQMKLYVTFK